MTPDEPVRAVDRLSAADASAVLALADAAFAADGVRPLSEDTILRLRHGGPGRHLLGYGDGELAGYAHLDDDAGELVVHPRLRRRGHGTALLSTSGPGPHHFWAHGDLPAARAFAQRHGFARTRVLWQMRRPLTTPVPDRPLPADVTIRAFRPGFDEDAWLDVNGRAFADHPEQGRWTRADLDLREAEPWFDPDGFLLAVDVADKLVGFHWTKVHPPEGDDPALGEIYVLGVDPGGHRRGLGAALTVAGLRHLAGRGLTGAMLYVDESNAAAAALYRGVGFAVHTTDVTYTGG
ncbi:mycothiol synthase [Mangrovihabitans endophyticus]|uniref:Mycothiol acetyltransferase n=1 Tax=Mangrovihabitans endophyticus TaxID=1751298 RepID=A0A8J3BY00_9ACTN|nr:mycothiol synthase [Mangrovihabitans endophyticus]GGK82547.1 mycothiol acetyltransferase [Mangrovihabitans endophyticus]